MCAFRQGLQWKRQNEISSCVRVVFFFSTLKCIFKIVMISVDKK